MYVCIDLAYAGSDIDEDLSGRESAALDKLTLDEVFINRSVHGRLPVLDDLALDSLGHL